jgi:peptide deformylase
MFCHFTVTFLGLSIFTNTPKKLKHPSSSKVFSSLSLTIDGCLSFLGVFVKIERPKKVTVKWQNIKGEFLMQHLDGMESKCFQHENDHLDGITFNTRVSKLRWDMATKKAEKKINA